MPVIRKDFGHPCFLVIPLLGLGTNPSPIRIYQCQIKLSQQLFTNFSQSRNRARSSNQSDGDYEPNVNMRIVGRAAPEQSG
jgi:hypothetical protein